MSSTGSDPSANAPRERGLSALDYGAFTAPIDRAALHAYRVARSARRAAAKSSAFRILMPLIGSVVVVALVVGGGSLFVRVIGVFLQVGGVADGPAVAVPVAILCGGLVLIAWVIWARWRRGLIAEYRLDAFASANGLAFGAGEEAPWRPGLIFSQGKDRTLDRVLRVNAPRFVEVANYRYTTGSGKEQTTHHWGYAAIRIGTPLPHIVLDARGNDGLFGGSNLPAAFDRDQRLRLEGDFDKHFALYCPAGYERDALYLFTPDIMVRFIDSASRFDVEIVDDWLFLYAQRRELVAADPAALAEHLSVVEAVAAKLGQWERWRDERLESAAASPAAGSTSGSTAAGDPAAGDPATRAGDPGTAHAAMPIPARPLGVAPEGLRLRRRFSWSGFAGFAAILGFFVWQWMR